MSHLDSSSKKQATETMVFIHVVAVLVVCAIFGTMNIVSGAAVYGMITLAAGIVAGIVITVMRNNSSTSTRGVILSVMQTIIIFITAAANNDLHGMFPLMVASMAIAAIYFSRRNVILQWILYDIPSILGLVVFKDFFYGSTSTDVILKGLIGVNIGAFLILYLMNCSLKYISEAEDAGDETARLLVKVREQMNESEEMMDQQTKVVNNIAEISERVNSSSGLMLEIADKIKAAAEEQEQTISDISQSVAEISAETERGLAESERASEAALKSTGLVHESNREMQNMLAAMSDITESSHKIESIIKTIEDIAFQTNILALNAAVEAARAGAAGKGFAVVADEVRNLANRSAEAVQNTSALIQTSIESVEKGTVLAKRAAEKMAGVMDTAESSAEHAKHIAELTDRQTRSIEAVKEQLEQISVITSHNAQTSVESTDIARSVAREASIMDDIVKHFRDA